MKKTKYIVALLTACIANTFSVTAYADLIVTGSSGLTEPGAKVIYEAKLVGTISSEDEKKLNQLVTKSKELNKKPGFHVTLDSNGGDIYAAMAIGRILRKYDSMAAGFKNNRCMSSCVFVLAGAPYRATDPAFTVGIHRPYAERAVSTTPAIEKAKYDRLQITIEGYLNSMNVSPALYKDMILVPPEQIKILTYRELEGYGLADNDPYLDEANKMKKAQEYGISRRELARREALINQTCISQSCRESWAPERCNRPYYDCEDRILTTGK